MVSVITATDYGPREINDETRVPLHRGCVALRLPCSARFCRKQIRIAIDWADLPHFEADFLQEFHHDVTSVTSVARTHMGTHPTCWSTRTVLGGTGAACEMAGVVLIIQAGKSRQNQRQTERRARLRQSNSLIGLFIIKSRILCCDIIVCFIIITERFPRACGYGLMFDFICCIQHFPSKWAWVRENVCMYAHFCESLNLPSLELYLETLNKRTYFSTT